THCRSKSQSPSQVVRLVIRHLLSHKSEETRAHVSTHDPDRSKARTELRLTISELESVKRIADQVGASHNKWISDLVRAYITHEPQFGMHELQMIGESNSQLRAIGRNLNQIALALNRGSQDGDVVALIARLISEIDEHTEMVHALIHTNLARWRVTWP